MCTELAVTESSALLLFFVDSDTSPTSHFPIKIIFSKYTKMRKE